MSEHANTLEMSLKLSSRYIKIVTSEIRKIEIFPILNEIRMNLNVSEFKLKVGKKGEIYTTAKLRKILNLKPGSTVIAKVVSEGKVLIEVTPTIEELLKRPKKVKLSVEEVEKLSVEAQEEVGIIE